MCVGRVVSPGSTVIKVTLLSGLCGGGVGGGKLRKAMVVRATQSHAAGCHSPARDPNLGSSIKGRHGGGSHSPLEHAAVAEGNAHSYIGVNSRRMLVPDV